MPIRALVIVGLLAGADYLAWNWSVGSGEDALSVVTGLALAPLIVALLWLAMLSTLSGAARFARAQRARPGAAPLGTPRGRRRRRRDPHAGDARTRASGSSASSSKKIAA